MSAVHRLLIFFVLSWAFLLLGCAGESRLLGDTARLAFADAVADITVGQVLNPRYRYLRLTIDGRPVLLVLGYLDAHPQTGQVTETWYSGQGEVLRLMNGRVISTAGMPVDWQAVRYLNLPAWNRALQEAAALKPFMRERDMSKTYTFGFKERVQQQFLKPAQPQALPKGLFLTGAPKSDLVWLEEHYRPLLASATALPSSWFALDAQSQVVYSKQCLSVSLCLHLQPWSLDDHAALQVAAKKMDKRP
jgi:hypothetical protein